jgi:hypothetical protein
VYDVVDKTPVDLFMSNVVELQLLVTRSGIVSIVLVFSDWRSCRMIKSQYWTVMPLRMPLHR